MVSIDPLAWINYNSTFISEPLFSSISLFLLQLHFSKRASPMLATSSSSSSSSTAISLHPLTNYNASATPSLNPYSLSFSSSYSYLSPLSFRLHSSKTHLRITPKKVLHSTETDFFSFPFFLKIFLPVHFLSSSFVFFSSVYRDWG